MMSYKEWKMINESFGGNFTLGLKTPASVGITGSKMAEMGLHPDPDNEDPNLDDDHGGGDEGDLGSDTGLPNLDDMDLDALLGHDHGGGDDNDMDDDGDLDNDSDKDDDSKTRDGDDDGDEDDDAESDDSDGFEPKFMSSDLSSEVPMDPSLDYMKKDGHDKNCSCHMHKESDDFFSSLFNQARGEHGQKFNGGLKKEDFLLPPPAEENKEPGPGEVGYAPQGRLNHFA